MVEALNTRPEAFDSFADTYDADFTDSEAGRWLRRAVWQNLVPFVRPGLRVLDLGCGTGADAIWLAQAGCNVTAADASPAMLDQVMRKAKSGRSAGCVNQIRLDLNAPGDLTGPFDLVLSNFGALNCVIDLKPVGNLLRRVVAPGGTLALTVMGRFCAWESLWHGFRGRRIALRRWRGSTTARIGTHRIPIRYWRAGEIRTALSPKFRLRSVHGIGVVLPPSEMFHIFGGRPRLFRLLTSWEARLSSNPVMARVADHQLLIFERVSP